MGQQVAFVFLIILGSMILTQIILLANNEKKHYKNLMKEIEQIKKKLESI